MKKNQSLQKFEGDWFFFGRSLFPLEDDDVFDVAREDRKYVICLSVRPT